jgi:putative hemolysin
VDTEPSKRLIDLEQVFRSKSPRTANAIPGFVFSYLRRVIHEDDINNFMYTRHGAMGLDFVDEALRMFQIQPQTIGLTEELLQGRIILAGNHPLGGLDGLSLIKVAGAYRPDIVSMSNDLLLNIPNTRSLFFGVNKHGSNADNIVAFDQLFAGDRLVMYFPAGLVSRRQKQGIRDLEWKPTFIKKAYKHQRNVVPVHISGRNSNFFYNLSRIRTWLGIKANIEMLYLVDEIFKLRDKNITMRFGKPIPWQTFDRRYKANEWAQLVKEHVYRLGQSDDPTSLEFNY